MNKEYRALAVFVAVADARSLSQAGRTLKLSTSVVSHHLSKLEEKLGVALFFRSSRRLLLTSEGHLILDAARRMVEAGDEAFDLLTGHADKPIGALKISIPAFLERTKLRSAIWDFVRQHPMVSLSLNSTDSQANLVTEGFDMAIRLGEVHANNLKCQKIGTFERILVTSPDYLSGREAVRTIEDLSACDFVSVSTLPETIQLCRGDEKINFAPQNVRIEVDSAQVARSALLAGLGIQRMPLADVQDELASGALVQVLPDWTLSALGIFAVWPDTGPQKKLTRRFIDHVSGQKA